MVTFHGIEDAGPAADDMTGAPRIPDRAIVVVVHGQPYLLYHHGTDLEDWVAEASPEDAAREMAGDEHAAGVFVWSGAVVHHVDYWGEHDEWLEGETRPISPEEWRAFLAGEWPFDVEACTARAEWVRARCDVADV
jgi:hypothetical protein